MMRNHNSVHFEQCEYIMERQRDREREEGKREER